MTRAQRKRVLEILTPFMQDTANNHAVLNAALWGNPVLNRIKWSDNPATFTSELVTTLYNYGADETGNPCLKTLLQEMQGNVGLDKRKEIQILIDEIFTDAEVQTQNVTPQKRFSFISYSIVVLIMIGLLSTVIYMRANTSEEDPIATSTRSPSITRTVLTTPTTMINPILPDSRGDSFNIISYQCRKVFNIDKRCLDVVYGVIPDFAYNKPTLQTISVLDRAESLFVDLMQERLDNISLTIGGHDNFPRP
jgi:hypothetical protein